MTKRIPALFVSHGAPTLVLEPGPTRGFLMQIGSAFERPKAILVISAHWETASPTLSSARRPETIHDFYGFPEALYAMRYAAPGAPDLAVRAAQLLATAGLQVNATAERGLDHGAWVPLMLMYPEAGIPVTQLSVQSTLGPAHHWRMGEILCPLRDEGVLIIGSGSVTHNLGEFGRHRYDSAPPAWVSEFNDWLHDALLSSDQSALIDYRKRAPHAARNHPKEEHLSPLFVAAGAGTPGHTPQRLHAGYTYGVIGMDAWRFD